MRTVATDKRRAPGPRLVRREFLRQLESPAQTDSKTEAPAPEEVQLDAPRNALLRDVNDDRETHDLQQVVRDQSHASKDAIHFRLSDEDEVIPAPEARPPPRGSLGHGPVESVEEPLSLIHI